MPRSASRNGQNHTPPTRPPGGPASNLRSSKAAQATSIPPKAQPSNSASPQDKSPPRNKEDDVPASQEDAEQPSCTEATALFHVAEVLSKILEKYQMPAQLREVLTNINKYTNKAGVREGKRDIFQITIEDVRDLRKDLLVDLSTRDDALNDKLSSIAKNQEQILRATDLIAKEATGINVATKELGNNQIANTTKSYKDVLLTQPSQPAGPMTDLKLMDDLERKAKQILVVIHSDDLTGKSLTEIKNKANKAIEEVEDEPGRPDKVEVETVTATREKTMLLQLNTKQAANWLRDAGVETKFTEKFAKDSFFVSRNYNIIVPRTPIIFNLKNEEHLREMEECNNLNPNVIRKARWIKPILRRREGQAHAYSILTITSPATANQLIRGGIMICGAKSMPTKLKREPIQCMRCRHWGHLAAQCISGNAYCGACGDSHKTSECNNPNKRYCTSCRVDTHASWDRNCPEFIRRCEIYNERYPENKLPFFPTDEEWTLTPRPDRTPSGSRFPQRYAVNSLPTAATGKQTRQQNQPRGKSKYRNRQPNPQKQGAQDGNNNSIEKYFTRSQPTETASSNAGEEGDLSGPSYLDEPANESNLVEQLLGNTLPGSIPGWS